MYVSCSPVLYTFQFGNVWLGVGVPYSTSVLHFGSNHCGLARLFGLPGARWKVPPEEGCGGIRLLAHLVYVVVPAKIVWDDNSQVLGPVGLVQDLYTSQNF